MKADTLTGFCRPIWAEACSPNDSGVTLEITQSANDRVNQVDGVVDIDFRDRMKLSWVNNSFSLLPQDKPARLVTTSD